MDRLTKRDIEDGTEVVDISDNLFKGLESHKMSAIEIDSKILHKLADYEDLEGQGRLLKLPCRMGDIVYEITGATIRGYDWKYLTYEKAYVHDTVFNLDRLYDIGKTVFLTKTEAEAKLKELQGKIS